VPRAAEAKRSQVMSNDQVDAIADLEVRAHGKDRARGMRAVVAGGALLLGLGGLAACGDDDDASDTVPGLSAEGIESSVPASEPTTTRASTTSAAPSTTARSSTTSTSATAATPTTARSAATSATETAPESTGAATESSEAAADAVAAANATAGAETTTAGTTESTATSVPAGSAPESSVTESSGPTTTGPECAFTENDQFPLVRCDAGPAIAALQSVLQAREYDLGTVDCLFGDQTLYAVRAFQADEELTVDGAVGADTWAALDILDEWGNDTNGNGSIEPDEITLVCA
jgi:Putative peptidoglycan binding domain